MNILWAIFLGVVQGLTEFFPVSSSAHLVLVPWIFKFQDPGLAFDIALHAGTLFAIIFALWSDWIDMAKSLFEKGPSFFRKLILFLVITSVPGALFGYFLEDKAATVFRSPLLIAATLAIFGVILWYVDRNVEKAEKIENMDAKKSLLIGLSQAVAIIPGVSRSGATITAGRALGFSREAATKYSFLAALPIILGATVFGLRHTATGDFISSAWIFGFLASFITSVFAIKAFLRFAKNKNFNIFFYYRLALAATVIMLFFVR